MALKTVNKMRAKPARSAARRKSRRIVAVAARETPYHHGSLHAALLAAAERVLERDGVSGLTLRAAAREAGVSHAAPTHHFGDITGLLSELAAVGFEKFNAALQAARASQLAGDSSVTGEAYVAFARAHPAMFQLMFRSERLDMNRPALRAAAAAAFEALARIASDQRHEPIPGGETLSLAQAAEMVRLWAKVHGFAMLLLDHRLDGILARLPAGTSAGQLLVAMLKADANSPSP